MKNIKPTHYLTPLFFVTLSFLVFTAPVSAKDNGSSLHKDHKNMHATKWPKKNENEAWDDEEFENDGMCEELNSEKEMVIDFQYLLKCLK